MNSQETTYRENASINSDAANANSDTQEEIAVRRTTLFEPDFNVYADRGSNCFKPPVISGHERADS